jgi:hypothetical protein
MFITALMDKLAGNLARQLSLNYNPYVKYMIDKEAII